MLISFAMRGNWPQRWAFYRDLDLMDIRISQLTARVSNLISLNDRGRINKTVAIEFIQKLGRQIEKSEAKKKQTLQKLELLNQPSIQPQAKNNPNHQNDDDIKISAIINLLFFDIKDVDT